VSIQRDFPAGEFLPRPLVVTCSALERAAALIESGQNPAKALRQVARELKDYAEAYPNQLVPEKSIAAELGRPQKRAA